MVSEVRMTAKGKTDITFFPQLLYHVIETAVRKPRAGVTKHGNTTLETTRESVFWTQLR